VNTLLEKLNEMLFEPGDTEAATNEKQPEQTRQESPKPEPIVAQEARAGESTNTTEMLQFLQSKVANHSPGSQETLAKFAKNLQVLEEFIPDENVRYRAAASQVSVPALLKAYRGCREALVAVTSEFKQAVMAACESQIKVIIYLAFLACSTSVMFGVTCQWHLPSVSSFAYAEVLGGDPLSWITSCNRGSSGFPSATSGPTLPLSPNVLSSKPSAYPASKLFLSRVDIIEKPLHIMPSGDNVTTCCGGMSTSHPAWVNVAAIELAKKSGSFAIGKTRIIIRCPANLANLAAIALLSSSDMSRLESRCCSRTRAKFASAAACSAFAARSRVCEIIDSFSSRKSVSTRPDRAPTTSSPTTPAITKNPPKSVNASALARMYMNAAVGRNLATKGMYSITSPNTTIAVKNSFHDDRRSDQSCNAFRIASFGISRRRRRSLGRITIAVWTLGILALWGILRWQ
jgi:hypothetical protein